MIGPQTTESADLRNRCGMRDCHERAFALFAWPNNIPVPLCEHHRAEVLALVAVQQTGAMPTFTRQQWTAFLREHARPQLVRSS